MVLLVDDDERVRTALAELLKLLGLDVLQTSDGSLACQRLRDHVDEVRIAVIDLTMPGMSGEQTLRHMQQIQPDIDALLISGYSEEETGVQTMLSDHVRFLHKPFAERELVDALSQMFARQQRESEVL